MPLLEDAGQSVANGPEADLSTAIFRELKARGMSDHAARQVAGNARRWWHNSAMAHVALPNRLFAKLGARCGPACRVV
jgi:hypothetical protein